MTDLAAECGPRRLFLHGPGGSGKTFCMTEVVMPVVKQFFGPLAVKAIAAANSAARLLKGKTMHAAGKLTRSQSLSAKKLKPNSRALKALQMEWQTTTMLLCDEVGLAQPPLLAGISRRASHGRKRLLELDLARMLEEPFGAVFLQAFLGDFMQLNPVKNHSLLEAFLVRSHVPGVPRAVSDEDQDGWAVFRQCCENVVVFSGTHRYLDTGLPRLLEIMKTRGGAPVPEWLRVRVEERLVTGPDDPRLMVDYEQEGVPFFRAWCQGGNPMGAGVALAATSCSDGCACGPGALCSDE